MYVEVKIINKYYLFQNTVRMTFHLAAHIPMSIWALIYSCKKEKYILSAEFHHACACLINSVFENTC